MHLPLGIGLHIGTKRREGRKVNETRQSVLIGVELVVADSGSMEAYLIHQRHHRIGRNLKHVVDGVARTVITCRVYQQVGIKSTQRVGHITQTWKLVDSGMGVVNREDMYLLLLCRCCQCNKHQQDREQQFFHYF